MKKDCRIFINIPSGHYKMSLFLVIFFIMKSTLSNINITISVFLVVFAQYCTFSLLAYQCFYKVDFY